MPKRKRIHVVSDPEQLEAIVSPLRHSLLKSLASIGPCSVKELAEDLRCTPESLYYHVRALLDAGLIQALGKRARNGRSEALYEALADQLRSDPKQTSPEYLEAYRRTISALLRLTDRQVSAALDRQAAEGVRRPPSLLVRQVQVRASKSSQREIARRIEELVEFIVACDDPHEPERVAYSLISAPME